MRERGVWVKGRAAALVCLGASSLDTPRNEVAYWISSGLTTYPFIRSDIMKAPMPRVILARHGETEWALSGQHTGRSDIPLTPHGRDVMLQLAPTFVSCDGSKMIDPRRISHILCSPRTRSQDTLKLMFAHLTDEERSQIVSTETLQDLREWDYGAYEGKKVCLHNHEI